MIVKANLYTKCGITEESVMGNPINHEIAMLMYIKKQGAECSNVRFDYTINPINLNRPWIKNEIYDKSITPSTLLPTVQINIQRNEKVNNSDFNETLPTSETLKYYRENTLHDVLEVTYALDVLVKTKNLLKNHLALEIEIITNNLLIKFIHYMKRCNEEKKYITHLLMQLQHVNQYMSKNKCLYVCSNDPCSADCKLLSLVHSIRIILHYTKNIILPSHMTHLWSYMNTGYTAIFFNISCPSDAEIIYYWYEKPEINLTHLPDNFKQLYETYNHTYYFNMYQSIKMNTDTTIPQRIKTKLQQKKSLEKRQDDAICLINKTENLDINKKNSTYSNSSRF
ncbi:hypothetical protein A3Q56_02066 [Intoshia linei]|uniref:Uncharacterized protein n=1 Tax=Intoshia linei TaxID=1819745 RepID=A0A177B7B9_9BILA|nr:hypothetical protein A3Q56_02066 [Intoshia linei]